MNRRNVLRLAVLACAALAVACGQNTGSGSSCPTESPKVERVQSCTVAPGASVSVRLDICPTCNLSAPTCTVDASQVGSSGIIALDALADACEPSSSCPSPSCITNGVNCTFTAPTGTGTYTLQVYDASTNSTKTGTLTVASGPSSCQFL